MDEEFFYQAGGKIRFRQGGHISRRSKVPRYSRETVSRLMSFLVKFTTYISKISFMNVRLGKRDL